MNSIELQRNVRAALASALPVPVIKYIAKYKGKYPVVVYREISNVPALHADNAERQFRCTYQVTIATRDDEYEDLEAAVERAMLSLGFMRTDAQEILDGEYFRVLRFITVCEK